jgi:NADH:ubiquinone oxidoreductase subunit 6 (subunit J)
MVDMNEKKVIQASLIVSLVILAAGAVFLHTVKTPGISRIPIQEIYSQGIALNFYVNYILPIVIVLAILFIAGLSTFGLYHEATREQLGARPLFVRLLCCFKLKRKEN